MFLTVCSALVIASSASAPALAALWNQVGISSSFTPRRKQTSRANVQQFLRIPRQFAALFIT
eukprot:CCRYP_016041-RB/>CCRYP_016041-RB protein AED:0.49 eAED:1.00 QI:0/0/0/1/0/0/2/0/61